MTTHDRDKVIAAAKEADSGFTGDESFNLGTSLVGLEAIERFYAIAFEAGAASRDAEVAELVAALETVIANAPEPYCAITRAVDAQCRAALAKVSKP